MKPLITTWILPLLVALSLSASHASPAHAQGVDPDDIDEMARHLGLSGDQKQKVQAIQDDLRKQMANTRAGIEVASIDLRRELSKDKPDEKRVGALVDKISQLEGHARKARIISMLRIKQLLSSEQRGRLDGIAPRVSARDRRVGRSATPPVAPVPPTPPTPPTPRSHPGVDDLDIHIDLSGLEELEKQLEHLDDLEDLDFDVDVDGLSAETRREIEREVARAKREAMRARSEALRDTKQAVKEAQKARAEAMKEARKAMEEARKGLDKHKRSYGRVHVHKNHDDGPGTVRINAAPAAEIYIDGKKLGRTPLSLELKAGRHRLEARWPDGQKKMNVVINEGEDINILMRKP